MQMALPLDNIFSLVTQFLSYVFSLMIGSMISGIVVTFDKGGRIHSKSGGFISFGRAFALVLIDIIISAALAAFASEIVQTMLIQNLNYIVAITSAMFLVFMLWFCHSFSYKTRNHWKPIVFLAALIIINIILVYLKTT